MKKLNLIAILAVLTIAGLFFSTEGQVLQNVGGTTTLGGSSITGTAVTNNNSFALTLSNNVTIDAAHVLLLGDGSSSAPTIARASDIDDGITLGEATTFYRDGKYAAAISVSGGTSSIKFAASDAGAPSTHEITGTPTGQIRIGTGATTTTVALWTNTTVSGFVTATNGFFEQVYTTTVDFTATPTNSIILINGATKTVTLPTAVGIKGKHYTIKLIAAATTGTVATTSSQNIDGATTFSLAGQYESVKVVSDDAQWWVVSNF